MDVTVFEQKVEIEEDGAGLALAENGIRAVEALGLGDDFARIACLLHGMLIQPPAGRKRLWFDYREARLPHTFCAGVRRASLADMLLTAAERTGVKVILGEECTGTTTEGDEAVVTFLSGSQDTFDAVIAADGARSRLRQGLGMDQKVRRFDFRAVCGLSRWRSDSPINRETWGADGRLFGVFPATSDETHFYCGAPARSWDGFHETTIEEWIDSWGDFGRDTTRILRAVDDWGSATHHFEISEVRLKPWYAGRVFVVGDAAHAICPSLGQGTSLAMVDGLVLARLLADASGSGGDFEAVGREYTRVRRPFVSRMQRAARMQINLQEGQSTSWRVARSASFALHKALPPLRRSSLRFALGCHRRENRFLLPA
jgi:2-polyprenyl-6-methoxyphenol hydroxylase-like FAD-dependent oxidoreductase